MRRRLLRAVIFIVIACALSLLAARGLFPLPDISTRPSWPDRQLMTLLEWLPIEWML